MRLSVVDIGSNSIHALFVEIREGRYHIADRHKDLVRLGDAAFVTGKLKEENMQRALQVLSRISERSRAFGSTHTVAVATAVLRNVENGSVFLERVRQETGLPVEIISGEREAFLIYTGAKQSVSFQGRKAVVIDIGGGSVELVVADQNEPYFMTSLPLGCNRLRQILPFSDPPLSAELLQLDEKLRKDLGPVVQKIKEYGAQWLIGTAGTAKNLFNVMLHDETVEQDVNGEIRMPFSIIKNKYSELVGMTNEQVKAIPGLSVKRADMFRHGLAVIVTLMEMSQIPFLSYATKAMREGLILDFMKSKNLV